MSLLPKSLVAAAMIVSGAALNVSMILKGAEGFTYLVGGGLMAFGVYLGWRVFQER